MRTKEEILRSQKDCQNRPITMFVFTDGAVWKMILDAMEEYKDQYINSSKRQITEKELKIAARKIGLRIGVIEYLISKVRELQRNYNCRK